MIYGAIPFDDFKHKNRIIAQLKREFWKVKIMVVDDVVVYKTDEKYRVVKL